MLKCSCFTITSPAEKWDWGPEAKETSFTDGEMPQHPRPPGLLHPISRFIRNIQHTAPCHGGNHFLWIHISNSNGWINIPVKRKIKTEGRVIRHAHAIVLWGPRPPAAAKQAGSSLGRWHPCGTRGWGQPSFGPPTGTAAAWAAAGVAPQAKPGDLLRQREGGRQHPLERGCLVN